MLPGSRRFERSRFHDRVHSGKLAAQEPTASFHIISKDGGFDPMITQLRRQGLTVDRSISIALMPCQQKTEPTTDDERLACLRAQFQRHPANRPKTEKALQGRIRTHFRQHLDDEGVAALIERMRTLGLIALTGGKVSYSLSGLHPRSRDRTTCLRPPERCGTASLIGVARSAVQERCSR
ncbi:MAG: hypothetical protein IPM01_29210 [Burkholderiaceae bacterium]|nr:hypothetical protein [Burkholderiaceae bacterium]